MKPSINVLLAAIASKRFGNRHGNTAFTTVCRHWTTNLKQREIAPSSPLGRGRQELLLNQCSEGPSLRVNDRANRPVDHGGPIHAMQIWLTRDEAPRQRCSATTKFTRNNAFRAGVGLDPTDMSSIFGKSIPNQNLGILPGIVSMTLWIKINPSHMWLSLNHRLMGRHKPPLCGLQKKPNGHPSAAATDPTALVRNPIVGVINDATSTH